MSKKKGVSKDLKFFVPTIPCSTNKIYAGMFWAKRKSLCNSVHAHVAKALRGYVQRFDCKVEIEFTPFHHYGRQYDTSNYSFCYKMIEDALVEQKVIAGDSRKHVGRIIMNSPVNLDKLHGIEVSVRPWE